MIRTAEKADTKAVAEIFAQLHNRHIEIRENYFNRLSESDFIREARLLIEGDCDVLVCEEDGEIKGYALVNYLTQSDTFHTVPLRCFVDHFAVKDDCKRQGVGTELMKYITDTAKERGCISVELGVWAENYDAVDFYATIGFEPRMYKMELML